MKNRRNYYRILHVQRDAPTEVIRSTYRTMMQKLKMHPDLGGNHEDAALINEAFNVLSDPVLRAEYDASFAVGHPSAHQWSNERSAGQDMEGQQQPRSDEQCAFCLEHCQAVQLRGPDDLCGSCDSPIYPARQRRFEVDCQRAIERIPKRARASFWVRWPEVAEHNGWVHDISLSGMQLRTDHELVEDQVVKVSTGILDAVARVIDVRQLAIEDEDEGEWRVGLAFLTMRIHRQRGAFVSVDA
jgi:hypothetical protein